MKNIEVVRKAVLEVMADLERSELFTIRDGDCVTWQYYCPTMLAHDFFKLPHNGKRKVL